MKLDKRIRALEASMLGDPTILYFADGTTREIHGRRNFMLDLLVSACGGADITPAQAEQLDLIRESTDAQEPGGARLTELLRILHGPAEDQAAAGLSPHRQMGVPESDMEGRRCDPALWGNFNYEKSKTSRFRDLLMYSHVNLSFPPGRTHRDVVEQIATEAHIPVELLSDELNQRVDPGSQAIFGFAGDELDQIAGNYDSMQWWVSDAGLNMAVVIPANPPHIPTFDELMLDIFDAPSSAMKRAKKRSKRYEAIDSALRKIAESQPKTHEEVFHALGGRVAVPHAEPFKNVGGWHAGFKKNPNAARAWLSKRWSILELPPFPRGPK